MNDADIATLQANETAANVNGIIDDTETGELSQRALDHLVSAGAWAGYHYGSVADAVADAAADMQLTLTSDEFNMIMCELIPAEIDRIERTNP